MNKSCRNGATVNRECNHSPLSYWPLNQLITPQCQARVHPEQQIEKIKSSIEQFSFLGSLLIKSNGEIICGVARVEAARRLGFDELPVVIADHLTEAQIKAYRIADNKLAELSSWDEENLRLEFEAILELDLEFDLELTGFDTTKIDLTLDAGLDNQDDDAQDDTYEELLTPEEIVSKRGDLWLLGEHKLYCGDAKSRDSYDALLGKDTVQMTITDPPWNVSINGHVGNSGKIQHREFVEASGEMTDAEFGDFLHTSLRQMVHLGANGSLFYVFIDWRSVDKVIDAGKNLSLELLNIIVWNKTNAGMGSLYRSKHELICLFKKSRVPHRNNVQLGSTGRYRTNVWDYAGANSFGKDRLDQLKGHPTAKPVVMIADAIMDVTKRGDLVLDPFCGSGTILLAAQKTGRKARAIELDPIYVDTAIKRFEVRFGIEAIHLDTGLTFTQLKKQRSEDADQALQAEQGEYHIVAGRRVRKRKRPSSPKSFSAQTEMNNGRAA